MFRERSEEGQREGLAVPKLIAMPAWDEAMLLERLIWRFQAPIWVRGAVQMETMGELGRCPWSPPNMLYVDLGSDITAGIVIDGRPLGGAQGVAGQIGHVYAGEPYKRICGCGNAGACRPSPAAGPSPMRACMRRSRDAADCWRNPGQTGVVTVADIGTAARLGDPFCADLLAQSGRLIGTVLATLVNALNPSMSSRRGIAQTGDICLAAIREGIYRHAQPLLSRDISIVRSRMGRSAGLVGAATVAVTELFNLPSSRTGSYQAPRWPIPMSPNC